MRGRYLDIRRQLGRARDGLPEVEGDSIVQGVDGKASWSSCGGGQDPDFRYSAQRGPY